jgi:hypothetical protein
MSHSRPARKVRAYRPCLEVLEDRNLLSTYLVDRLTDANPGGGGQGSGLAGDLRYAITQANTAPGDDTIAFSVTGTINLAGALPDLSSNLDIEGPGAASLTVRRNTDTYYRIFTVSGSPTVRISGLTISNGSLYGSFASSPGGGGILVSGGSVTLADCVVSNNQVVGEAGFLYGYYHSYDYSNGGPAGGGGVWVVGGSLTIHNSTISGNTAAGGYGGEHPNPSFSDNIADGMGGGLYVGGGTVTLQNSTISHNTATGGAGFNGEFDDSSSPGFHGGSGLGGGVYAEGGSVALDNCTISDNQATGGDGGFGGGGPFLGDNPGGNGGNGIGAGLWINGSASVSLSNCTVANNTATGGPGGSGFGGGLGAPGGRGGNGNGGGFSVSSSGGVTLDNCTVANNTAVGGDGGNVWMRGNGGNGGDGIGGGLSASSSGDVTLHSCTVAGNTVVEGHGGVGGFGGGGDGLWGNASGGGISERGSVTLNVKNTILATNREDLAAHLSSSGYNLIGDGSGTGFDPTDLLNVNPLLGPLQNNGGPTQTMALLSGSPALNAGDPAQLGVADQRGVVRSGGVNIGAYQASATAIVLTAPATVTAGTAFNLTVKAVDPFGQTAVGYTGTVQFGSTDGQAALPSDYPFTLGDGGMHVFSNGVTLKTTGDQTVTATDMATASITGSASVSVNPAAADHLLFLQQPTDTPAGQTIGPVVVEVVDQFGNVETSDNSDTITLSLGTNPSGGTLSGTLSLTVVNGVATFSDLAIDVVGDGYTLHAMATGLTDAESGAFRIT